MQALQTSVQRRLGLGSSTLTAPRRHDQRSCLSENVSLSEESVWSANNQRLRPITWDSVSQISTAAGNTSSSDSPAFLYLRSASYPTPATEPSPTDPSKLKKLGPLHEHLETIRKYTPGQVARDIWTASALKFGDDGVVTNDNVDAGEHNNSWTFWEKMVNTADALGTARYLNNAFDLHYLCFVEIFTDTGRRLSHWDATPEDAGQLDQDQKASKVMASTPLLLQLLTRAVIGAARSCTTSADSKLARVMLDAAHCVFRQLKYATRVRAPLILFDVYRNTLIDLWHWQNTPDTPKPHDRDSALPVSPKSTRLDQEYSLDDLVWSIHPAILNREYFVVSTHLLTLSRYHQSWLSLPARSTAWEKPLAEFVRNLAIPSKTSQAWVRLLQEHEPPEPPDFLDAYIKEAKAFLQWCTNAVFEGQTILNGAFADQPPSSHVVSRDSLNDARLTLYWFFVSQRKALEIQPARPSHSVATSLPMFPHSDNAHTTLDAFWVLSSFIFCFCSPEALPTSLRSLSDYTLTKLNHMVKWPYGFVWHYLQQTICHASKLHSDGDFVQQEDVQQKYIDLAILGAEQPSKADDDPVVQVAVELHPQPLPEFIDSADLHSHNRSSRKVLFTVSPDSYHFPLKLPVKLPVKLPKRRWLQRLSLTGISVSSIQSPSLSRPSMSRSRTEPTTFSTPTDAKAHRRSVDSWNLMAAAAASNTYKVEEFLGDYSAIVPDLLYTTCGIEESSRSEIHAAAATDGGAIPAWRSGADKVGSVVQSTEILLPEGRRPFVVLH
ncbi:hypothetical protein G647_04402 [Cladophialophora carrionii CBS 160.54]|uniref:Uncharacterized protein n=1 Tax=Cladophialophora carrionii CBS 160.54 TaxID=1279043 RepID=V9DGC8_9EURO|nr:uncharacterized protein G647_04402 [Cladophialophora carrionii CBS 160.54]ETI25032.1 hypothetical protein G647_04402 [Cladophialophora carrionii CBS 160.54]